MHHYLLTASVLFAGAFTVPAPAQDLGRVDDLKLQLHGFATQSFLYTTRNNWNTTQSSDGSAAWTEAVVNLSAQPESRLRIGVQARYFLLGDYGNNITLDWAQADFKFNEHLGLRAGKVKTMSGLLNESQDIDPAQLWILLPQSVYAIGSRNSILAHNGGLLYGSFPLGEAGRLEYRVFAGQRSIDSQDQDLAPLEDRGLAFPSGLSGPTYGGTLRWYTPLSGLMLGASEGAEKLSGSFNATIPHLGVVPGTLATRPFNAPYFFGIYDHGNFMAAAEYSRVPPHGLLTFAIPQIPPMPDASDRRSYYVMSSYKLARRLTAGAYFSYAVDRQVPLSATGFQRDWDLSARFDATPSFYLKAEQHFLHGTLIGFSQSDNPNPSPSTRMTLLKLGVIF